MQAADYAAMPRAAEYVKTLSAKDLQADAACSGWLRKRSEHVKQWNKRWFVLWPKVPNEGQGRLLVYYAKPNDERARGSYRLHPGEYSLQTEQTKKHKVCLVLTTNKPNKWDEIIDRIVLSADEVEKAVDWARAINSTGIAAQKKERKAPSAAQLGSGLGNIIEECDEEEEEEEEEEEGEGGDESGSEMDQSDDGASSAGDSEPLDTPPLLAKSAGVQEGVPPLLLQATEPEPEPELTKSGRIRLMSSKGLGGSLDETAPVRACQVSPLPVGSLLSPLTATGCACSQRLSPTSPDGASVQGGDSAFAITDGVAGSKSSRWRKAGRRGVSEGELLEERRPSISVTGLDYNAMKDAVDAQDSSRQGRSESGAGTPRQAVPVLGLKPWNANRATSAPMHLDLQIAKELKTLDWSPGAARKASPLAGSGDTANTIEPSSSGGAEREVNRSASAPDMATSLPPTSPSPSTSPGTSPAKAAVRRADGSGNGSESSAGGTGRTLAAALRSSIGGSTPENKALQEALLRAGAGDVRSVLHVMSEHVNGVNAKLRAMELERTR